jgi:hypothetical protein
MQVNAPAFWSAAVLCRFPLTLPSLRVTDQICHGRSIASAQKIFNSTMNRSAQDLHSANGSCCSEAASSLKEFRTMGEKLKHYG